MSTAVKTTKANMVNGTSSQRALNSARIMVNGAQNKLNTQTIGRYTVLSKSTSTTTNGGTLRKESGKGFYHHPTYHHPHLDNNKRSQSQQNVGRNQLGSNNQILGYKSNDCLNENSTDKLTTSHPVKPFSEHRHSKSHSVSSTLLLREQTGQTYSNNNQSSHNCITNNNTDYTNNYPVSVNTTTGIGGSYSCGQPSPSASSSVDDTYLSPNNPQSNRPIWLHQSAVTLTSDWDETTSNLTHNNNNSNKQNTNLNCTQTKQNHQLDHTHSVSTTMLYGQRNNHAEDYNNAYPTGPSFRKIQNLHGGTNNQKRYPSDTTLNVTTRDGAQIYTSGSRPGPVTIPARSRSVQPSPGTSPVSSPVSCLRVSDNNLNSYNHNNINSNMNTQMKFRKMNLNFQQNNGSYVVRNGDAQQKSAFQLNGHSDNGESHILPSVREIIRQVEAMTQSNTASSAGDLSGGSQQNGSLHNAAFVHHPTQTAQRKSNNHLNANNSNLNNYSTNSHETQNRNGVVRPTTGSSQRTPSAPQMRSSNYNPNTTTQYTPIQAKFNATVAAGVTKSNAPPVPPHGTNRNKPTIGTFTRRPDANNHTNEVNSTHKQDYVASNNIPKKSELLSHLPNDYQKLREAFIEQRREIQRLRKQLAEKDIEITRLERDIRLYEPWR